MHRFLGGLAVVFTAVHVVAILFDTFVTFSLVKVLVPFTGARHPGAVAWGIVAMYALAAVEITSLLRTRISKRAWRATHYLSFPLFERPLPARKRRPHPARRSRRLVGAGSVAAMVTLTGCMAASGTASSKSSSTASTASTATTATTASTTGGSSATKSTTTTAAASASAGTASSQPTTVSSGS
jgi:hypothetical protein